MGLQRVGDDWATELNWYTIQGHEKVYGHNNELAEKLSYTETLKREKGNGNSRTEKYKFWNKKFTGWV